MRNLEIHTRIRKFILYFVAAFSLFAIICFGLIASATTWEQAVSYYTRNVQKVLMAGIPAAVYMGIISFFQKNQESISEE